MTCPSCGAENRAGRKFCAECGTSLALACPACGAPNEPGERFCGECGQPLETVVATAPPSAPPPSESERRLVSVLFADLVGFTELSEGRDAEEVRELLSRYFELARQVVGRFGGLIEKFIGDAVMAVWGTPVAREDDAERAVRAALDLVSAVHALAEEVGVAGLDARVAVLTGEAAVTLGAEGEGMVAGDLVNTASRAQSIAPAGTVLVGERTRRATEAAIAYEEAGAHDVKGKSEPLRLWRAERVVAARRGEGRTRGLEAPFVGRAGELRLVKDLFHATADERKSRLVSVVGVAGIGKTRLSWEFEKYIDGLVGEVFWHRGRCLSYGEGVAYWALAEMVRRRAGIVEEEAPALALTKLDQAVDEHVTDPEERAWLAPRLAHLLGLGDHEASDRADLFSAWRIFFERLAERNPTVLLFEDLQWADSGLLDFVEYLLDWSRNHPLFVLTLSRPEISERHPNWGAGKRNFTSLYLEPLPADAMDELLRGLVPGLPDDVRAQIGERAEGVPLYAVETVRMLLDRGLLERVGDEYRPTGDVSSVEVPETLHALIAARLDGVAADERRVLEDASVLGKTFTAKALAVLSGVDEQDLEPLLASLVRKEILALQADSRSPELGQYGFLQALVQKVAHDTLSRRERKARHLAAAAYFETSWGSEEDELPEVVAAHYLDAYEADPNAEDATAIKTKAREQLVRAAERAASLAASVEAHRYYDRAAELATEALMQAELLERSGTMASRAGAHAVAVERLERAIELFAEHDRPHAAARVSAALGRELWDGGEIDAALSRLQPAYAVLSEDEPDADLGFLAAEIARLHVFRGNRDDSAQWIEAALEIAEALGHPALLSEALNTKHLVLSTGNRREEATALLRHSLDIALAADSDDAALRAYFNLSHKMAVGDRHREAISLDEAGLELARKRGHRRYETQFLHHLSIDHFFTGEWDRALAYADELIEIEPTAPARRFNEWFPKAALDLYRGARVTSPIEEEPADMQERAGWGIGGATASLGAGEAAGALEAAETVWGFAAQLGMHVFTKEAFALALDAAFALDGLERVEKLLGEVRAMKPGHTPAYLRAHSARAEGRLAAVRGEDDRVEPSFEAAAAGFRAIDTPFWAAVCELELAEWLVSNDRNGEAESHIAAARETFERLGARPWLERLDANVTAPV